MPLDPYDTCPCGSGKKFKWCCQPYFHKIEQSLDMHMQGQHENALRLMEQATRDHPDRPQVWAYYANLLNAEGQTEKAEEAIGKAFELDPGFGMGHFLRGMFRQQEGEVIGALLLFRKAAEAYSPEAHDQLAQVYELIARNEIMLNRPVAARAALERAAHFTPADRELREQFELLFGEKSRLPRAARKKYTFRPTAKPVAVDAAATGRLSDARKAFEALTQQVPNDPAGWFNLGLVRAWLGEQPAAVEALNKSVEQEWDDTKAEEAAALAEVLKCGHGMEGDSDYTEHRVYMQLRDPQALSALMQAWAQESRIVSPEADPETGTFSCLVVEPLPSLLETGTTMVKVMANLVIAGGTIRLWHPNPESVRKVSQEIRDRLNLAVGEPAEGTGPSSFGDLLIEALAYPTRTPNVAEAETKLAEYARRFFEDEWTRRPLRALSGATPLDAAGSKLLRKKLLGVIRFLEDVFAGLVPHKREGETTVPLKIFNFDQLRHKLGAEPQPPGEAPTIHVPEDKPEPPRPAKLDFAAMSAADLAELPTDQLSAAQLEEAVRAALKLDARELAVKFARDGVAKPADPNKPDRYPLYAVLITGALSEGDTDTAIKYAEAGAGHDATHNEGKRANDFTIRKAQLLAKRGDADAAAAEFQAAIERNPDEPKLYIAATEAMLSARNGAKALHFAESGLAKARTLGHRDFEGACQELSEAARKQMN